MDLTESESVDRIGVAAFADFRVDLADRRLYHLDDPVHLTPRVFALLRAFLERPGVIWTREELIDRVWQGRFVEDASLTQAVFVLRRALEDDVESRRIIVTESGVGYRFIAPIRWDDGDDLPPVVANERERGDRNWSQWLLRLVLALGVLTALIVVSRFAVENEHPAIKMEEIDSLAVLPFVDLSTNEPSATGLAISDALVGALSGSGSIVVRPMPTVLSYYEPDQLPQQVGSRLRVDGVLVGTLLRADGKLSARAQLVETNRGRTLWTASVTPASSRPVALKRELVEAVVRALLPNAPANMVEHGDSVRSTDSFEAYERSALGHYWLTHRDARNLIRARDAFQQAVDMDPGYVDAIEGLADAECLLGFYQAGTRDSHEHYRRAKRYAQAAIGIDPTSVNAHTVLGMYYLQVEHDQVAAQAAFEQAIRLGPDSARSYHWYSWYLLTIGEAELAARSLERAFELDPLSLIIRSARGMLSYYRGHYEESLHHLDMALAIRDDFGRGHLNRGLALEQLGRTEGAQEALQRARDLLGPTPEVEAAVAHLMFTTGRAGEGSTLVRTLEAQAAPDVYMAIAVVVDDAQRSLDLLELAFDNRRMWPWLVQDPRLSVLRGMERFERLRLRSRTLSGI